MNRRTLSTPIAIIALAACSSNDAPALVDPLNDAATTGRIAGHLADGGIDCNDHVNTPTQTVVRACIYEIPDAASAAQALNAGRAEVTVRLHDAVIATYGQCGCDQLPYIELIPEGARPESYEPPPSSIRAADYDQSCNQDADCIETFEGTIRNGECHCPNAALNQRVADTYQADFYAKRPTGFFLYHCDCGCYGTPVCRAAVCSLAACGATTPSSYIDAGS